MTAGLFLALLLLSSETAGPTPTFPWTSLRAIAQEHPTGEVALCNPALFIERPQGFYRLWAMAHGPEWMAVRYDGEARPDSVWRGTWSRSQPRPP